MTTLDQLQSTVAKLISEDQENTQEFNALVDDMELLQVTNTNLTSDLECQRIVNKEIILKLTGALASANKQLGGAAGVLAELKELRALNPKRLSKLNKDMKKRNTTLKQLVVDTEKSRKEALALYVRAKKLAESKGKVPFYIDPDTNNSLFAEGYIVGTKNTAGLLGGAPIVIYNNESKGITRQGMLTDKGNLIWASATNTSPTPTESRTAKQFIIDYCKKTKVKVPNG
jgi:hypothetical protein